VKVLLDTNAWSALQQRDAATMRIVARADQIVMSSIVVGELLAGFHLGARAALNRRELGEFLDGSLVQQAAVTRVTADRYAVIFAALRRKGRPIPTNDMWIAAHALETGAELLSFDGRFEHVDGLVWTHLPSR
jgi:tRNA(fMet)-specific endonuclease VapC